HRHRPASSVGRIPDGMRPPCVLGRLDFRRLKHAGHFVRSSSVWWPPQPLELPAACSVQGRGPSHLLEMLARPPFFLSLASSLFTPLRRLSEPVGNAHA